jgi:hypothetical protein
MEPKDVCDMEGCEALFHHACSTHWKSWQYHLEEPNGPPKSNPDSEGLKHCMKHHHPHEQILSSCAAKKTKTKINARDKKTGELDWAKK